MNGKRAHCAPPVSLVSVGFRGGARASVFHSHRRQSDDINTYLWNHLFREKCAPSMLPKEDRDAEQCRWADFAKILFPAAWPERGVPLAFKRFSMMIINSPNSPHRTFHAKHHTSHSEMSTAKIAIGAGAISLAAAAIWLGRTLLASDKPAAKSADAAVRDSAQSSSLLLRRARALSLSHFTV
jgi:hypothetical protein